MAHSISGPGAGPQTPPPAEAPAKPQPQPRGNGACAPGARHGLASREGAAAGGEARAGQARLADLGAREASFDAFWRRVEDDLREAVADTDRIRAGQMSGAERREAFDAMKGLLETALGRLERCGVDVGALSFGGCGATPPQGCRPRCGAEPKPEPKTEPAPKPEPNPEPKPDPKPEPTPAPKPEPKPEPTPAPAPTPKPEAPQPTPPAPTPPKGPANPIDAGAPSGPAPTQDEIIAAQTLLHAEPTNAAAQAVLAAAAASAEGLAAQAALAAATPSGVGADPSGGLAEQTAAQFLGVPQGQAGALRANGAPIEAGRSFAAGDRLSWPGGGSATLTEAQAYEINVRVATAEAGRDIASAQAAHLDAATAAGRSAYDAALAAGASRSAAGAAWTAAVEAFEARTPAPWAFPQLDGAGQADTLAGLAGPGFTPPQILQGADGPLQLHGRNAFFQEVSAPGGLRRLDQVAGRPSEALADLFANPGGYELDCATGANAVLMKGVLDTIGADAFDRLYPDGLDLSGWGADRAPVLADHVATTADGVAKFPTGYGFIESVAGDVAPFDPSRDALVVGETVYFEAPGDKTSFLQGWNAVYLGADPQSGAHLFFSQGAGLMEVRLDRVLGPGGESYVAPVVLAQNGRAIDGGGAVAGTYLGTGSVGATHAVLLRGLAA